MSESDKSGGGIMVGFIVFLICFPFAVAAILSTMRHHGKTRRYFIFASCIAIVAAVLSFCCSALSLGSAASYFHAAHEVDMAMMAGEFAMMGMVFYYGRRYRKNFVILLSVVQTLLIAWVDLTCYDVPTARVLVDRLTLIMCLIIGIVGTLICVYAAGYMRDYHIRHTEFEDRRAFFFAMLFTFLGAMFGLVLSCRMTWIYFFWEITSIVSFLLIGYNRTPESVHNSFTALWMNLLGGLGFAVAIVYSEKVMHITCLQDLVFITSRTSTLLNPSTMLIPIVLLAFAALTKSAQMPFSGWLLGAMVAPTPTSALLHSATMVKGGVYLLLRLSPALYGNMAGALVTTVGGFTFFITSLLAIAQSDGKKVLAYSTISNLGLIAACAGIGLHESVWAGILLMMFHAVSKSLLFLSVGAIENIIGSRNIEDMHGLIVKLPELAFIMIIGIAGMFLAPFGMLISKWAALKSFVDSKSVLMIVFLVFGSASTLFYWTKWLGTLVAMVQHTERRPNTTKGYEMFSLICQALIMIFLCVTYPIASSYLVIPFLAELFRDTMPVVISTGDTNIMLMMMFMIFILPVAVRFLTFGKKNTITMSYMGGSNVGDDREFIDSCGEKRKMYLANWYMEDYFGEKVLLRPSLILSTAVIVVMMILVIGGAE